MKNVDQLVNLVLTQELSYNVEGKKQFHKLAKSVLRKVANLMALRKGDYTIRSNMAGIAVSGEVTLHAEHIYIQLQQGIDFGRGKQFMFRWCNGQKDYTGGVNQWMKWEEFRDILWAVNRFIDTMNGGR